MGRGDVQLSIGKREGAGTQGSLITELANQGCEQTRSWWTSRVVDGQFLGAREPRGCRGFKLQIAV